MNVCLSDCYLVTESILFVTKFCTTVLYTRCLESKGFVKIGPINFDPHFPHFLTDLDEILYTGHPRIFVG